jgi:hypothetical protein
MLVNTKSSKTAQRTEDNSLVHTFNLFTLCSMGCFCMTKSNQAFYIFLFTVYSMVK